MRHLNLVFQGGGVKGIAYAGVLSRMPKGYRVNAVAGTSAGAIAAALVAIGTPPEEIQRLLSDPKLFDLLSATERARAQRLERVMADLLAVLGETTPATRTRRAAQVVARPFRLGGLAMRHWRALNDLRGVWNDRGFHSTHALRTWLEDTLGKDTTFGHIKTDDLKIVAADLTGRQFKVFEKRGYEHMKIVDAVHASVSIPLFFKPFLTAAEAESWVDGGILSNFPSFLFAQSEFPTVGFRFSDLKRPSRIGTTLEYLQALVYTMTDAHDKLRGDPPHFVSYEIPTEIRATQFHLTPGEADGLFRTGQEIADTVDWKGFSSDRSLMSFYDARPHDVLKKSLENAFALLEKYKTDKRFWSDAIEADVAYVVWIEKDWTVRYTFEETLSVRGPKPLFFSRLLARWDRDVPFGRSLADLEYEVFETTSGQRNPLIHIPAFNKESSKGFVVLYTPPISDGETRRFFTAFSVPAEFARTVGRGGSDVLSFDAVQMAARHTIRLSFRVLADDELPPLQYSAPLPDDEGVPCADTRGGRSYSGMAWKATDMAVTKQIRFETRVERAS